MADEDTSVSTDTSAAEATEPTGGGIKTAAEVIEKVLASTKEEGPSVAKGKPAAAPLAKVEPTRRVEKLEAKAIEKAATEEAEPDDAAVLAKAHYHLKHGDIAKFIDVVAGDFKLDGLADGVREALGRKLGVSSAQWEKLRKFEAGAKRAVAAREQELGSVVERLKAEYAPFHQARKAYEAGDYDAAFKAAFGEDAADYQRKIIGQRVGKNPEVEKLRAELEQERAERRQRDEQAEQARAEAERNQQIHDYLTDTQRQCAESEDLAIRKFSHRPAFIQRIYAIQQASYDARTNTVLPLSHAAEMARDEILNSVKAWSLDDDTETGASPANAARASALPVKPPVAKAPARALKQSQAAEANGKPVKRTPAEVREYHQRLMESLPAD
jgi:hypothetical protein